MVNSNREDFDIDILLEVHKLMTDWLLLDGFTTTDIFTILVQRMLGLCTGMIRWSGSAQRLDARRITGRRAPFIHYKASQSNRHLMEKGAKSKVEHKFVGSVHSCAVCF
jgi:hypothetical protein